MEPAALEGVPVPTTAFIVAGAHLEMEIASLLSRNPKMKFVVYTLELDVLSQLPGLFAKYGVEIDEVVQVSVSKLNRKTVFVAQPSPWIITAHPTK
jgi:precorrin-6Y C5,15-methyltransferase (decarboxylating)